MSDKQYEVAVPCLVHVPVQTANGPQLGTLYAGNVVPASVPKEKLRVWLDNGLIREVGAEQEAEPKPVEPKQDPEGEQKPNESKQDGGPAAKAPEKVTARSNRAELLAYATTHGELTQEEAESLTNKQLIEKFVGKGE